MTDHFNEAFTKYHTVSLVNYKTELKGFVHTGIDSTSTGSDRRLTHSGASTTRKVNKIQN